MIGLLFFLFIIGCGYFFLICLPLKYMEDYKSFSYRSRHPKADPHIAEDWNQAIRNGEVKIEYYLNGRKFKEPGLPKIPKSRKIHPDKESEYEKLRTH